MADKIEEGYDLAIRDMLRIEKEQGLEKARQLAKYQGVTSLNRVQAMEIMSTIWPEAPEADKLAAAMLCSTYGLNPLANHIFLIPYEDKKAGTTTWSRVWGIRAKRLLATRRGTFSYMDMSPRVMTKDEQVKVWGQEDKANLCYLTHLKDMKTGAEVYGYGKWPRDTQPKGTNKGNSQANMASIRSESQALDRLRPAEMPSGFVITDEDYIDAEVVPATTDLSERFKDKLPPEKPAQSTTTITSPRPPSTTLEDAQNSVIAGDKGMIAPEPEGSAVTAENQGGKVSLATSDDLARLTSEMRNAKWDMFRLGKYIKEQGWAVTKTQQLTTAQVDEAIKDILADSVK